MIRPLPLSTELYYTHSDINQCPLTNMFHQNKNTFQKFINKSNSFQAVQQILSIGTNKLSAVNKTNSSHVFELKRHEAMQLLP